MRISCIYVNALYRVRVNACVRECVHELYSASECELCTVGVHNYVSVYISRLGCD